MFVVCETAPKQIISCFILKHHMSIFEINQTIPV